MKNVKGQRNRQVLADIGNLDVVRIAEEKRISRPITRLILSLSLSLSLSLLSASASVSR